MLKGEKCNLEILVLDMAQCLWIILAKYSFKYATKRLFFGMCMIKISWYISFPARLVKVFNSLKFPVIYFPANMGTHPARKKEKKNCWVFILVWSALACRISIIFGFAILWLQMLNNKILAGCQLDVRGPVTFVKIYVPGWDCETQKITVQSLNCNKK